jgi:hypothetical protein
MGSCPSGKMQRILASQALTDFRWAGRWTMNGFALYFQAKIRLKYDCGSLPKNRKKCFSYGEKRKEEERHGDLDRER